MPFELNRINQYTLFTLLSWTETDIEEYYSNKPSQKNKNIHYIVDSFLFCYERYKSNKFEHFVGDILRFIRPVYDYYIIELFIFFNKILKLIQSPDELLYYKYIITNIIIDSLLNTREPYKLNVINEQIFLYDIWIQSRIIYDPDKKKNVFVYNSNMNKIITDYCTNTDIKIVPDITVNMFYNIISINMYYMRFNNNRKNWIYLVVYLSNRYYM